MANYANLKSAIQQYIKQNGNEEITGAILQTTLLSMVDSLASGYLFKGLARPLFAPAASDGPVYYLALEAGSYINFPLGELGATAILREGYLGIFRTSGGASNWTFTEVAISIQDGIVTTSKIVNGAVTTQKIADLAITTSKIADNAVGTTEIEDGSITPEKLTKGAVTTNKIADDAVTGEKIAGSTIERVNLANGCVSEEEIESESILTRHIINGQVTMPKLGEDVIEELDHKANNDGSYDTMSVGMAKNIEAEAPVTDTFAFNKSGGDTTNPSTGICLLNKIYGNGAALSQLYPSRYDDIVPVPSVVARYRDNAQTMEMACYLCSEKVGDTYTRAIVTASEVATFFRSGSVQRNIIDLAVMYGITGLGTAGNYYQLDNAPSTPAEFAAEYFKMFGEPYTYVAYGSQLLSTKMVGLKSVGFNQYKNDNQSIKMLGGKQYQITGTYTSIAIDGIVITPDNSGHFTPTIDSILVVTGGGADTCVHFAGDRDGQYEPYWERIFYLDVTQLFGTKDGGTEGHYYRFAKEGMRGAGTAQDVVELVGARGEVKCGKKTWQASDFTLEGNTQANVPWVRTANNSITDVKTNGYNKPINAICTFSKRCVMLDYNWAGKYMIVVSSEKYFLSTEPGHNRLSNIADACPFDFFYELATPITFTSLFLSASSTSDELTAMPVDAIPLDELTRSLMIDAEGTMEVVMTSPLSKFPTSVAPTLEILYGLDAAKFITDAPKNYMSMASMDAFTSALGAAIGQTISKTWDSSNNRWNFTFTQNRNVEVEVQPEENR